jgi:hypothetical protein
MSRVYGGSQARFVGSLNSGCQFLDQWLRLKNVKGYFPNLILVIGLHVDGSGSSSPPVRLGRDKAPGGTMATGLRELKLTL